MIKRIIRSQLTTNLSIIWTINRIVYDSNKNPINFRFVDANKAFEEKMGFVKKDVKYKLISDWLLKDLPKKWMARFLDIALNNTKIEFDDVIVITNKIFTVTAYLIFKKYLVITFHEAKKYKMQLQEYEQLKTEMKKNIEISTTNYKSLFMYSPSAIVIYDVLNDGASGADYIIKAANQQCLIIEGFREEDFVGKPLSVVRPNVDDFGIIEVFQKVWKTGVMQRFPAKAYQEDKHSRWFENIVFKLPTGEVVAIYNDITKEKERQNKIEYLTYHDSLTGLYNRQYLMEYLSELDSALPKVIIMGDLVGLKLINDAFGHLEGDRILKATANVLSDVCRKQDLLVRLGGDEFLILLIDATINYAEAIVNKIKNNYRFIDVYGTPISISLGYSGIFYNQEEFFGAFSTAETFMYKNKLLTHGNFQNNILSSIKTILFEKSNETEEHGSRIKDYCLSLGRQLNLSLIELDDLEIFAMIHDVGKISIDNEILNKKEKLLDSEWAIIKNHPESGFRIISAIPNMGKVAEYILSHHERWDGKGYPRGLKGEEIPLPARILTVVDAYDAMTNDRAYRKALSKEEVILELVNNKGTQFDPHIVDLFLSIVN